MADSHEQENVEEGATTLGSDARTVRKLTGEAATLGSDVRTVRQPTGETPGAQSVRNVTGTVTEGRRVEETPPNTWEQVLQCLSPERCEVTGESSKRAGKACQQEVAEELPQEHASDQENTEDEESSCKILYILLLIDIYAQHIYLILLNDLVCTFSIIMVTRMRVTIVS